MRQTEKPPVRDADEGPGLLVSNERIGGNKRLFLWLILCLLTLLIFIYPAHLVDTPRAVESMHVFDNLPLFAALFSVWFAVLLMLTLSNARNLEEMALLCLFTLVFAGIWVSLRQSYAGEASRDASNIAYLVQHGFLSSEVNIYRHDFPGCALVGAAISTITGMADFDVLTAIMVTWIVLFPITLYLVFKNIIADSRWAALGALFVITGSILLDKQLSMFHPDGMAVFLLFAAFVLWLTSHDRPWLGGVQSGVLLTLFLFAITATHLVTSVCVLLTLLGVFVVQALGKKKLVSPINIVLCVVVIAIWGAWQGGSTISELLGLIPQMVDDFRQGTWVSGYAAGLVGAYTSEANPLWANVTRYFWVAFLLLLPALLGIKNLLRPKRLTHAETILTGGLAGVGVLFAATVMLGGMTSLYRFLYYAPFFTVPLVIVFCRQLRWPLRRYSLLALAAILLCLSFPTFLAHNNTVGTDAYYRFEFSGYQWISRHYGDEQRLYYGGGWHPADFYFEPPSAECVNVSLEFLEKQDFSGLLEERLQRLEDLRTMSNQYPALYIFEYTREIAQFEHLLGLKPDDSSQWREFLWRLTENDRTYSSGFMQIYKLSS